jgi:adenylate cyclase
MDVPVTGDVMAFEAWRYDPRAGGLLRQDPDGKWVRVHIGARARDILAFLLQRPGELVSKDALLDAAWPNVAVEPNNLTVQIAALRRVLDEGRRNNSCIQTVPGRGYRFVLPVNRLEEAQLRLSPGPQPASDPAAVSGSVAQHLPWRWSTTRSGRPAGTDPTAAGTKLTVPAASRLRPRAGLIAAIATLFVCGAVGSVSWMLRNAPAPTTGITVGRIPAQDRRQSIIILPFENASGDPAQDSLAAHMTSTITSKIVTDRAFPAIPKMTDPAYRGGVADPAAIGRQYGVHFVLIGNARRQDGRLVVSAVLYETLGDRPLWSAQLDRQDDPDGEQSIAQSVYESVWQYSIDEEAARAARDHPNSLDKRDLVMMALSTRLATPTKAHLQEQMGLIERALVLDPNDFNALQRQARSRAYFVMADYSADPAVDLAIADNAANHMLQIQPNSAQSLRAKATVLRAQGKWQEAEAVLHRVIGLEPTEANRHWELGQVLMAEGRHLEALASLKAAKRFAGGADPIYFYDAYLAMAELANGQLAEAIATARLSLSEYPPDIGRGGELPWLALIGAKGASGKDEAARADVRSFLATPRSWHSMTEIEKWQPFAANPKLLDGLRQAGMPAN